jgi:membrane protein implicated in regulation of membrane protease activity
MANWEIWAIAAGILVALELFSGTFYLLMLAVGAIAGAASASLGSAGAVQLTVASVVAIAATLLLRRSRFGMQHKVDAARDPNVNPDIGQSIKVENWEGGSDERRTARVLYRGAQWDVELEKGNAAEPGHFVIREVRGNRLIVAKPHH